MAIKAYEAEKTIAEIAEVITQNAKRMDSALETMAVAKAQLNGMATAYGPFIVALDAAAAANPNSVVWTQLLAQKDLFVSEFAALKTYAAALEAAATGVVQP